MSTDQDRATPEERDRSPIARPRAGPAQRGSGSDGKAFYPEARERWVCPVSKCQDSAAHPLDECGEFKDLSVSQRRKCSRNGVAASAASRTAGIGRLAAGATVGSDFDGMACWGWCLRQGRTRLRAEGVNSNDLKGKPLREARTTLGGSPARLTVGVDEAKESCRGDKRIHGVSPLLARTES
jgi:hypothetical protein